MARNREFDDALDELKMLHDAKNHDYATAENPYKNLEGVSRIGIEPWRGIVIRLMDKFSRLEEYCVKGKLAIQSEGVEDTLKDISVYSLLAMILFRKEHEKKTKEWELPKFTERPDWSPPKHESLFSNEKLEPVDDKYNGDESFTNPIIAMRESAEKQQEDEENQRRLEAFNLLNYEEQEYWMKKARNN